MDDESSRVVVVGNIGAAGLTKAKVVVIPFWCLVIRSKTVDSLDMFWDSFGASRW
jgi:hypothetical protein